MRANRLQELVPLLEVLPVLARLRAQEFQRFVALKGCAVDPGDDRAEARVIVKVPQPVCNVDELLNLPRPRLRLVVTKDQ